MSSRNKKKFADYVVLREAGVPIAIVEAKDNNHTGSHGMQQALGYAGILDVPSAFSSNGDAFLPSQEGSGSRRRHRVRTVNLMAENRLRVENDRHVRITGDV
jgi:type I site-specific restriction endonuclease